MSQLILYLFHGRLTPDQDMDDWGTPGPAFKIDHFHVTYFSTFWIEPKGLKCAVDLSDTIEDSMVYYDGVYYGDFTICNLKDLPNDVKIINFDEAKMLNAKILKNA